MPELNPPPDSWGPWLPSEQARSESRHEAFEIKGSLVDRITIVCFVEAVQHELPKP